MADKVVKITKTQYMNLKKDRAHMFQTPNFHINVHTRDRRTPLTDTTKYVDLCWYNHREGKWEGLLDLNRIPPKERARLGSLYGNPEIVLYCKIKDVDAFAKLVKKHEVDDKKLKENVKNKFL